MPFASGDSRLPFENREEWGRLLGVIQSERTKKVGQPPLNLSGMFIRHRLYPSQTLSYPCHPERRSSFACE